MDSESGRGIYPDGLYRIFLQFHERYKHFNVPFIVSENGVSDGTNVIRRPNMLEHLLAVFVAILAGVPVLCYLFWTISDNWECANSYSPEFGLVEVDHSNNLARIPWPSYHMFSKMISEAIASLKERTGSSQVAIAKFIEEKQKELSPNFRKLLLVQLKKIGVSGKLMKVNNSFKLSGGAKFATTAAKANKTKASKYAAMLKKKSVYSVSGKAKVVAPKDKVGVIKPNISTPTKKV